MSVRIRPRVPINIDMKILVVGMPRSRSNYLTQCLGLHHAIKNLGEPYKDQFESLRTAGRLENFPYFANQISNGLVGTTESFICKLQTTNIPVSPLRGQHLLELGSYKHFQFDIYDHIYITVRRNLVEQICSTIVAVNTGNFVFGNSTPDAPLDKFTFDTVVHSNVIAETLTNLMRIRFVIKHLKSCNIPFDVVYYEDSPSWVQDNLGSVEPDMVETNFDYSKIFTNYVEMEEIIQAYFGSSAINL